MTRFLPLLERPVEIPARVQTVRDVVKALPSSTPFEIRVTRDAEGLWRAWPVGGPWPETSPRNALPVGQGSTATLALFDLNEYLIPEVR